MNDRIESDSIEHAILEAHRQIQRMLPSYARRIVLGLKHGDAHKTVRYPETPADAPVVTLVLDDRDVIARGRAEAARQAARNHVYDLGIADDA